MDTTGSMSGAKITNLKATATNLIDQFYPNGVSNNNVKISLVPFSYNVRGIDPSTMSTNGTDQTTMFNANYPWIDTAGQSSIHWENFPVLASGPLKPVSRFELFRDIGQSWAGCFESRPGVYALGDQPPNPLLPDSLYVPYFAPDEGDNESSSYNNYMSDSDNASFCANNDVYAQNDTHTPFFSDGQSKLCKYIPKTCTSTTVPVTTTTMNSVTTCSGHGSSKVCTTSQVPVVTTTNVTTTTCVPQPTVLTTALQKVPVSSSAISNGKGPNHNCPTVAMQPLTNNPSVLKAKISALTATGNTNLISGLMWGWHTLSPNQPLGSTIQYNQQGHKKVMIFMTDGDNTWSTSGSNPNVSDYSPFGYFWNERLGQAAGVGLPTASNVGNFMVAKTLEACTNAKAAGVTIFTIGFSIPTAPISAQGQALLKSCASTPSNFYLATDTTTSLANAFTAIGNSLAGLYITR